MFFIFFILQLLIVYNAYGNLDSKGIRTHNNKLSTCLEAINFQELEVSGKIIDIDGTPLVGVNIYIKGTSIGTMTDFDGKFRIPNVSSNANLETCNY